MDWIVFAEDWGRHPSTTQHLVANLPASDRVLWVESIGMRAPRLRRADLARVVEKLRRRGAPTAGLPDLAEPSAGRAPDEIVKPVVLPWHEQSWAVAINRLLLREVARRAARTLRSPVLVTANPAVVLYADVMGRGKLVYLRLDDFATLPGVDASLVRKTEALMFARADLVVVPNQRLVPAGVAARVLPQGVDVAAFEAVPLEPPRGRGLGYWGTLGEWIDFDLVAAVARALPEWRFEFVGHHRDDPVVTRGLASWSRLPNIVTVAAVPHARLGATAAHWAAAWAPFIRGLHLTHASPLKLREYLAAGFPVASTPMPEADEIGGIAGIESVADVVAWLGAGDHRAARAARRASMDAQSWSARAQTLRSWIEDLVTEEV